MLVFKLALEKNHFGYFEYDNPDVQKGTKFSDICSGPGSLSWEGFLTVQASEQHFAPCKPSTSLLLTSLSDILDQVQSNPNKWTLCL